MRRLDYPAAHDDHTQIARMVSGHQRFSGVLVPTLCQLLNIGTEGVPAAKPSLLDVEIFDAHFEQKLMPYLISEVIGHIVKTILKWTLGGAVARSCRPSVSRAPGEADLADLSSGSR